MTRLQHTQLCFQTLLSSVGFLQTQGAGSVVGYHTKLMGILEVSTILCDGTAALSFVTLQLLEYAFIFLSTILCFRFLVYKF